MPHSQLEENVEKTILEILVKSDNEVIKKRASILLKILNGANWLDTRQELDVKVGVINKTCRRWRAIDFESAQSLSEKIALAKKQLASTRSRPKILSEEEESKILEISSQLKHPGHRKNTTHWANVTREAIKQGLPPLSERTVGRILANANK